MTYIAFKIALNGQLTNKEHLNSVDEVNEWLVWASQQGFNNVKLVREDGVERVMTRTVDDAWLKA